MDDMRLDSFLSRSRLVPRRGRANEVCRLGLVLRNDRPAKPADKVQAGDRLTILYNDRTLTVEVVEVPKGNLRRADASSTYRLLEEGPAYDPVPDHRSRPAVTS